MYLSISDLLNQLSNTENNSSNIVTETKIPKQQVAIQNKAADPYSQLRIVGIEKALSSWLKPWPTKNVFAITEVTGCLLQTYIRLKGLVNPQNLDISRLFYLLELYGKIGETVHKYIYDNFQFKQIETMLTDKENHVGGKIDGLTEDNILWELKSGKVNGHEENQIILQYYLLRKFNYDIKEINIWWILQQKISKFKQEDIEPKIDQILQRPNILYKSLQTNIPPIEFKDLNDCKYCPAYKICQSLTGTN